MTDSGGCLEALPWETRNLGMASFAVRDTFLAQPDAARLAACLAAVARAHQEVFVQARFQPDTRISQLLESHGFYYVETALTPTLGLLRCSALDTFAIDPGSVLPRRYALSELDVQGLAPDDAGLAATVANIAGESFIDDRFHVDHNCTADLADRRYRLWVADLLQDASVRFQVLRLRDQPIAFMASRSGTLLLAGFARRYARAGLGEYFWLHVLQRLRADGVQAVRTVISVNNLAVLNLYARLGFKFGSPHSTYHRWVRAGS